MFTAKVMESVNKERDTKQPSIKANGGHKAAFAIYGVSIVGRNTFSCTKDITIYLLVLWAADYSNYHKKLLPLIKILKLEKN